MGAVKFRLLWLGLAWAAILPAADRVYIGTYTAHGSKGIYRAEFDPASGELAVPVLAATAADPSFLIASSGKPFVYAVNEGSQKVSAFQVLPGAGDLMLINQAETGGGPCHLALDRTGRMLVVADYGGGNLATFPVRTDGSLGNRASLIRFTGKGPNAERQEAPHAHSATFTANNRFLLVNDLGTDRTLIYRVHPETAQVDPLPPGQANPGAGPRHLVIDPQGRYVYVLNEIQSTVTRFAWDAQQGSMRKLDTTPALPADFHGENTAAEIAMDKGGKTIYTSNRGHDSIAVFHVSADGSLKLVQNIPSGGKGPRNFAIDPAGRWLLAANQTSGNVAVFAIDGQTGQLADAHRNIAVSEPVCLLFIN